MTCTQLEARAGSLMGAAVLISLLVMGVTSPSMAQTCDTIGFASGTEWSLCWELRQREGLIIRGASYTDRGGTSTSVLHRGSIAEVHVPYHTGTPRFLDLTLSTLGLGANALDLSATECNGALVNPKVCREIHERGHAWTFANLFQIGQEVTYWISSQLGNYNYITSWTFRDDGSFRPEVGFTGRLQIVRTGSAYARFGARVNAQASSPAQFGINHMHNVYWRLDLEVGAAGDNAVNTITQVRYTGSSPDGVSCTIAGTCHINEHTRVTAEGIHRLAPFKTWHQINRGMFNTESRPIGYELIPEGNQFWTGPSSEPWAEGELYVTSYDACELFAVNNNLAAVNPGCGSSAPHVRAMVNAQAVDGADIVLWYNTHFQHVVRDEDQLNMPIETAALELEPRSWRHINTLQ
jgi:primary-amine oxidase